MSAVPVVNMEGASAGEYEVQEDLIVRTGGERVLHETILAYLAAQRTGTASTLSKGEVAGSNAKPWKQKGTGRARAGYRQSPVWRGGSVVFGPKPRSYSVRQNKKEKQVAFRRALSEKIISGQLRVIDALKVPEIKTRHFAAIVKALDIKKHVLFVVAQPDDATLLAARNIPKVDIMRACDVHPYHILRYQDLVVTREGMDVLVARLGGETKAATEEVTA